MIFYRNALFVTYHSFRRLIPLLFSYLPSPVKVELYRLRGYDVSRSAWLSRGVILNCRRVRIGENVRIGPFSDFTAEELLIEDNVVFLGDVRVMSVSRLTAGEYTVFGKDLEVRGDPSEKYSLEIGQNCWVGPHVLIDTHRDVRIGNGTAIGDENMLWTHGFYAEELEGYPVNNGPVTIGNNCWFPPRVVVFPGVTVGDNAILGTGAIVTKDVDGHAFTSGIPATRKMGEDQYRRSLSTEAKLARAEEIFLERVPLFKYRIEKVADHRFLVSRFDAKFLVCFVMEVDATLLADVRARFPGGEIVVVAGTQIPAGVKELIGPDRKLSLFDFETKTYRKLNTRGERAFKWALAPRYARFTYDLY